MNLLPNEPASIAKILDASFKLFKVSFKKTIGFGLLIGLISAGVGILAALVAQGFIGSGAAIESGIGILLPVLMFLGLLSYFWLYGALIFRIDDVVKQGDASFSEALGVGLQKFPTMLLGALLYSLAIILGLVVLVVPGLILSLSLFFYAYYIVLEDYSAYQSLKASHKLVWKDWWRTAGVFTVPGVLAIIIIMGFGVIAGFLGGYSDNELISWPDIFVNILMGIFYQYFYALGYVQFHDLKLRKSGSDLEARMADMSH